MRKFLLISLLLVASVRVHADDAEAYLDGEIVLVPRTVPAASELKPTDWSRYDKIIRQLTQENYLCLIRHAANLYSVDAVAIMGSIIGEHTYNVNIWDYWGERYLSLRKRWVERFRANGMNLTDLLNEPKYARCTETTTTSYDLWECYNSLWRRDPRNVKGHSTLKWTFFNPVGSGYTYGLGQLGPDRALMVTDIVHDYSGLPYLDVSDPEMIYDHILNPQTSIHYIAASILVSIRVYREVARFDISENPGVIATLYNLGNETARAKQKQREALKSLKSGGPLIYPATNHFGALVNYKQDEIRQIYTEKSGRLTDSICRRHLR